MIGIFALGWITTMLGGTEDHERDEAIHRAMAATLPAIAQAERDPGRPAFHFRAPAQWMNDPNGPIFVDGWYHVFYQFNPFGDHWGNMHWGHARSRDLVDWENLPVALWPSKSRGEDAIFSGSTHLATAPDGRKIPTAFYTSIGDHRPPEQWSAVPLDRDLIRWEKTPGVPVLTSSLQEWRDPFLFNLHGATYLITGGGENGHGIVAAYRAKNPSLTQWESVGTMFHHPDKDVANIECPNLAEVDGKWVLLVSVHGQVESFVGKLDDGVKFHSESRGVAAPGSYASQLLANRHGELIHLAWVPTDKNVGWNGFMTLPSRLRVSQDGLLLREPISELHNLRTDSVNVPPQVIEGEKDLSAQVKSDQLEIDAEVEFEGAAEFRINLRRSADGSKAETLSYPSRKTPLKIHLFLDRSVVDEYLDGGATTRVIAFSPIQGDKGLSLTALGGRVRLKRLEIHTLRAARFDNSRFH